MIFKRICLVFIFIIPFLKIEIIRGQNIGSGKCLIFSDVLKTRVLIPDDPSFDHPGNNVTIEAWIYPTAYNAESGGVLTKHSTVGTREFDVFILPDGRVRFSVYDLASTLYMTISPDKVPLNSWSHVAGTYNYSTGIASVYINGVLSVTNNIGVFQLASTNIDPMIGAYWLNSDTRSHFIGSIDEVRLWYSSRTQTEIRDNMCKRISAQANLVAYYSLDQPSGTTAIDKSGNGNNGTLLNFQSSQTNNWSYSGAPIGDQSIYQYSSSWAGIKLILGSDFLSNSKDTLIVDNISGNLQGLHLYRVDTIPNSLINVGNAPDSNYWGTFIANGSATYRVTLNYNKFNACIENPTLYKRNDNSDLSWVNAGATNNSSSKSIIRDNLNSRGEFIMSYVPGGSISLDLGSDTSICEGSFLTLDAGQGYSNYTWEDGSVGQTFSVSNAGSYWVTITNSLGCSGSDTINVDVTTKPYINLGNDTSICFGNKFEIKVDKNKYLYKWQDGSSGNNSFIVDQPGIYWVEASNVCGKYRDSVVVMLRQIHIPNLITPNHDSLNETIKIEGMVNNVDGSLAIFNRWGCKIYENDNYKNEWPTENIESNIYYYHFKYPGCESISGWVEVIK